MGTVVVGTVIDMEMTDELRVTVVATGIGAERKPDISLVSSEGSRLTQPAKEYGNTQSSEPRSAVGGTEGNQALKEKKEGVGKKKRRKRLKRERKNVNKEERKR